MKKLYLLIVFLCAGSAFAQSTSSPPNFKYHDLPNGQRVFVPYNSPLPSSAQQAGQQLWNQATASTASGQVEVGRSTTVPNPAGSPVPATARGRLPAPAVAAAVGRVFTAAAKTIGPIGVGLAIYELALELGVTTSRTSTGLAYTRPDPSACTVDPCYVYSVDYGATLHKSGLAACTQISSNWPNRFPGHTVSNTTAISDGGTGFSCYFDSAGPQYNFTQGYGGQAYRNGTVPAAPGTPLPLTEKQFLDMVAARSGWPATSKVSEVVLQDPDASQQTPVDIVASGPASSPGPVSQTTNTTNNTTNNTSTTYNHTYAGDKITTNVSTVNITTNNSTGAVTNNETTTSSPPAPPAPPSITCGLPGTPACKFDESGTPSSAGTTYDASKTAIDAAKTSAETNITGAASIAAPAWSFSFALPTGCAPYVTGIKGVVLNVCQYQSTIHGLLSVIWAAATAFAMIGMVGRTIRES